MKISLKKKALKTGRSSLYLEFYDGYSIDEKGVKKHHRKFEYLKMYIWDNPKTSDEKH
jgi:hypothetical protein